MGIQGRDDYRLPVDVKHVNIKKGSSATPKTHHSFAKKPETSSSLKPFLYSTFILVVFWKGASVLLDGAQQHRDRVQENQIQEADQTPELSIPGGLILQADASGHFRGTVLINDVSMPFMIDTGATQTVIPEQLAAEAGLPIGRQVQTSTAGGQVIDHLTRIDSLKIGNAKINSLPAIINRHLSEVLIGMTTLKHFQMTQNKDTLTLVAYNDPQQRMDLEKDLPLVAAPPVAANSPQLMAPQPNVVEDEDDLKPQKTWKKSVTCDASKNCTARYSDH